MFNSKILPAAGSYPQPQTWATVIPRDNLIVPTVTGNARQFVQTTTTPAASTRLDSALSVAAKYDQQVKQNAQKASETSSNKLGEKMDAGIGEVNHPSVIDNLAHTLGVSRKVLIGGTVALLAYYILTNRVKS